MGTGRYHNTMKVDAIKGLRILWQCVSIYMPLGVPIQFSNGHKAV